MESGRKMSLVNLSGIKINRKKLDKNQYLVSLLQECMNNGLLGSDEVYGIQAKIMDILKEIILRYTGGESTSVTVEITESLLNSLLYGLDFYLLRLDNPETALEHLRQGEIKEIYEKGLELLRLCIIETKALYEKIRRERLKITLEAYNATIDEAIPIFFGKYSAVFEAHSTMASIDYPLVFDDMKVRGISYIKNYLEHLDIETEFCRFFPEGDVKRLITGYEKLCRLSHNIELINVFEILVTNSIFSVLCGNSARELNITEEQFGLLNSRLQEMDLSEINFSINETAEMVIQDLNIVNPKLKAYIRDYKKLLERRLPHVLENNNLNTLMVIQGEKKDAEEAVFAFSEGKRMNDRAFKKTVSEILKLSKVEEKINIINLKVHSLQDYIDILNSDCFFGDEYKLLFTKLGDIELAILVKLVFYEELRAGSSDLSKIIAGSRSMEAEWQKHFSEFIAGLSDDNREKLNELLYKVDYDEISLY